ncbi:hypothetical protein LO771_27070 [Streptacidiphilus sp. ASG 303]|uniref:hypothetical protein n=1 Tax=Streptacidiphilus sp. ASG 303 TaxID=2896847 RepID=UPI001E3ABEAD|nr:hypothetical protein [Streptacidiphilus sp. ASG 303]MCD0485951.1 hypothetical protein [Streptacidiphilus sp. ASG 303]
MASMRRRAGAESTPQERTPGAAASAVPVVPLAPQWLALGRDGRLSAYATAGAALVRWTEQTPGSDVWTGPDTLPLPDGAVEVTLAQDPDLGYVHLAALRPGGAEGVRSQILVATQFQSGRPLSEWHPLNLPDAVEQVTPGQGAPRLAVGPDNELMLFFQHRGKGLWVRIRDTQGRWNWWKGMQGQWISAPVAARAGSDGSAELLAPYGKGAVHWRRPAAGKPFERLGQPEAKADVRSYVALETAPGRATWFWRTQDGGVHAWRAPADGDGPSEPAAVGCTAGSGPVAAARTLVDGHDCTVLVQRGADGRAEVAAYPTEAEESDVWWTPTGGPGTGTPGMLADGSGRLTLASIGPEGGLSICRRKDDEDGLAFGAWRSVGAAPGR